MALTEAFKRIAFFNTNNLFYDDSKIEMSRKAVKINAKKIKPT
jgi:hypothetical protein